MMLEVKRGRGGRRPGAGRPKGSGKKLSTSTAPVASQNAVSGGQNDHVVTMAAPPVSVDATHYDNPLDFLLSAMNNQTLDMNLRVRAALSAAQYKNPKYGDGGKKENLADAAKKAGAGRFAPAAAPPRPKLVSNSR